MKLFALKPKTLFLIDGVGALFSALMLGVVLARFESFFGIPTAALYTLAIPPLVFAAFDGFSYFTKRVNRHKLLKAIATANISYCVLSLGLAWQHSASITSRGWTYLLGETLVVLGLAVLEFNIANKPQA